MFFRQLISLLTLTTMCTSAPTQQMTRQLQPFDNLPWKLSNIVVFEPAPNMTIPSSIDFDLENPNLGFEENTHCNKTAPAGFDLTSKFYLPCGPGDMGFSYRGDSIWIHHFWRDERYATS
jgi:hypothetical protein